MALVPQKLPKDYLKELSLSHPESQPETGESETTPLLTPSSLFSEPGDSPLDIKSKVDTRKRPLRWEMSRYGRNTLMRAGACFDSSESTHRLLLTGTLPGSTIKAFKALAEYSTYATKTLTNWITRRNPGCAWQYAWEFQGRGALHLHMVIEVPVSVSEYVQSHFKDEWNRILRKISNLSGVDLYQKTKSYSHTENKTQADVTICTKEPSRYISKYISKSATNAKAFSRFPPKTWYQCSRSLLGRLRDRTQTYECEGLSYRQALKIQEDATHYVSQGDKGGQRRFSGAVYAWSGYVYGLNFNPSDISEKLMKKNQCLISVAQLANAAREVMKSYPGGSCYIRARTHPQTLTLMERGMLSETELLLYVESVIETLSETLPNEFNKHKAAWFLKRCNEWYLSKYGYQKINPELMPLIDNICKGYLTGIDTCTKLEPSQLKMFDAH